ncbi:unnamed protein product [Darwinula stevensoni]|uniref:FAD/NAD(P)-binding domain-containing protein n=1 Tax=Darwinula stevensoni TaxID=69355 RepID=A0A7R9AIC8_9CRUS|nr:unnamed protein product [Darwinula stevensoni]CAG0905813.1 unnamed protein product [Darwinula stevensoni]
MLHVTPPMYAPEVLRTCEKLVDQEGYLDVDKNTLQHKKYPNIFGVGDCTNIPTAKTAAAISEQLRVLKMNLFLQMEGKPLKPLYDGYSSCPLLVGFDKCILAEFDFDGEPLETFPVDQGSPRRFPFLLKRDFMPHLYWLALLTYDGILGRAGSVQEDDASGYGSLTGYNEDGAHIIFASISPQMLWDVVFHCNCRGFGPLGRLALGAR